MLLFSRQGKLRLQKWYTASSQKEKKKITRDLITTVLARKPKMCSFLEYKDLKVVYKRYFREVRIFLYEKLNVWNVSIPCLVTWNLGTSGYGQTKTGDWLMFFLMPRLNDQTFSMDIVFDVHRGVAKQSKICQGFDQNVITMLDEKF